MVSCKRGLKLPVVLLVIQALFIIFFWSFVEYGDSANARAPENNKDPAHGGADPGNNQLNALYPMFQDVQVMVFAGFGLLMMFLKRYGFSSPGYTFLIATFVIQWATLLGGFLQNDNGVIHVNILTLMTSDFTAAACLISYGAVLGKTSALQLIIMALCEVVLFKVNEWVGVTYFRAVDLGGSIFIHTFGAYFGITVARVLYTDDTAEASEKEGSVYHSDLFSMTSTLFLWLFWPSFNSALAVGDDQHRAVINTYYVLASSTVTAYIVSALVDKHNKFNMIHIQNATLSGGVAVGAMADMMIEPWAALVLGVVAGIVTVLGFQYITPFLNGRKFHDTCGVNNLHGMPGIISGLGGIVVSVIATEQDYGKSLYQLFPARAPTFNSTEYLEISAQLTITDDGLGRTAMQQGAWQAAALATTLGMAIVGGLIVGFVLRLSFLDQPKGDQVFDDEDFWLLPTDDAGGDGGSIPEVVTITGVNGITNKSMELSEDL